MTSLSEQSVARRAAHVVFVGEARSDLDGGAAGFAPPRELGRRGGRERRRGLQPEDWPAGGPVICSEREVLEARAPTTTASPRTPGSEPLIRLRSRVRIPVGAPWLSQ